MASAALEVWTDLAPLSERAALPAALRRGRVTEDVPVRFDDERGR